MQQLEFSQEELAAFRTEHCKGFTDEQFTLAIAECKRRNLVPGQHIVFQLRKSEEWDPVLKVNVPAKKMVKITTIDALRLISQRTNEYEGQGEGEFYYLDDQKLPSVVSKIPLPHPTVANAPWEPWAATIPIFRKGFREPVKVVARFDAYAVFTKGALSNMWARRGPEMLLKCAEAAARRAAFPEELAGLYLSEEFEKDQPEIETPPPAPAPTALVVPTVNHAPAVISNESRPNETKGNGEALQHAESVPDVKDRDEPVKVKRAKKVNIEDTPIEHVPDGFVATDDDLPAIMFEGPENADPYKAFAEAATNQKPVVGARSTEMPAILGAPYGGNVQKIDKPLSKKEIGDKIRSFYDMASAPEISKYILGYTGVKSAGEVTQQQWKSIFEAFDMLKIEGKEAFQQLLKGVAQ